ncbi:hypothetical protein O6H91_14G008900 [Diphasiastrum complanatum]|nr:hypothetical protein O6H91_14G008900 [Diphasiastrum complanatum]
MYEKTLYSKLVFQAEISPTAKDIIGQMLEKNPEHRLGSGPRDAQDIMDHIFFSSIDWNALSRREISPPFVPDVKSKDDVSNFDSSITSEPVDKLFSDTNSTKAVALPEFDDYNFNIKPKKKVGTQ